MNSYRFRCYYEKSGTGVFISIRNLQKLIERSFRRLDIPLKFTEGFSPHPKMSFCPPLPVNIAGTNEYFDFFVTDRVDETAFVKQICPFLPEGIFFRKIKFIQGGIFSPANNGIHAVYTIEHNDVSEEILMGFGEVIENNRQKAKILIKINNFSHKPMLSLLYEKKVKKISREVIGI